MSGRRHGAAALALLLATLPAAALDSRTLDRIPVLSPALSQIESALIEAAGHPRQYAVDAPLDADLAQGRWTPSDEGTAIWQLRLYSPGAASLSAELTDIQLPEGARLHWRTPDASAETRPYTPPGDGRWWTPEVAGEWGLLELQLPAGHSPASAGLHVRRIFHGRLHTPERLLAKASSGCNIDTACGIADPWRPDVNSVVRLTIDNRFLCSGTLIDNSRRDDRPLLMTARHCGIDAGNARSVVAHFNYQRSSCGGIAPVALRDRLEGSRFIGESAAADTTLIALLQAPPAHYNIRYAGWNAEAAPAPQNGAGIHHPSGDVKKISLFHDAARREDGIRIGHPEGDHFTVDSWSVAWAEGTTETGSSGSGLWNADRELVGVLSGGSAACDNPGGRDYYGRLEQALATSPTIARALDPDGDGQLRRLAPRPEPTPEPPSSDLPPLAQGGGSGSLWLWALLMLAPLLRHLRP